METWTRLSVTRTRDVVCKLRREDHDALGNPDFLAVKSQRNGGVELNVATAAGGGNDAAVLAEEVLALPIGADALPALSRVSVSAGDIEDAKAVLDGILDAHDHLPCMEGQVIRAASGAELLISETEPFTGGLVTRETEIIVEDSVEEEAEPRLEPDQTQRLLNYAYCVSPSAVKKLCSDAKGSADYPFQLHEICSELGRDQVEEFGQESLTVIVSGSNEILAPEFCWLQTPMYCSVLLRCVRASGTLRESDSNNLFATPSLLETLAELLGQGFDGAIKLTPFRDVSTISEASEASIAFLSTPTYDELNQTQVEAVLKGFFEEKKYLVKGQVVEVSLDHSDFRLPFESSIDRSVFFKVIDLKTEHDHELIMNDIVKRGAFVSSKVTKLYQKHKLRRPMPPRRFVRTESKDRQVAAAAPFIWRAVEDVAHKVKCGHATSFLLAGRLGSGIGRPFISALECRLGLPTVETESSWLVADSSGGTEAKLRQWVARVAERRPCIAVIKDVRRLAKNREGKTDQRVLDKIKSEFSVLSKLNPVSSDGLPPVLVVGECERLRSVDAELAVCFDCRMDVVQDGEELGDKDRLATLKWIVKKEDVRLSSDVSLSDLSRKTPGFLLEDLRQLVRKAEIFARERAAPALHADLIKVKVDATDVKKALKAVQTLLATSAGAPKIPEVHWEDVGGLEDAKREILDTIQLPLLHPELLSGGGKRSGILMYGPPGVGKTLLAKAVATECALNFLSVKGPELLNMYVGQSEENVRDVFCRARSAEPCVVFFDELDSLAPNRGRSGDSGGVMDRVVSQLLAELDVVAESDSKVFVIGATNRPDLLDPSLMRPGRFDRLVYLGIGGQDVQERRRILSALTRKFRLPPDLSVDAIAEDVIPAYLDCLTGADLAAICSRAAMNALATKVKALEAWGKGDIDSGDELEVTREDFEEAVKDFKPSVSQEDLKYYESIKQM